MTNATCPALVLLAFGLLCVPHSLALPAPVARPGQGRRSPTRAERRAAVVAAGVLAVSLLASWPWWFGVALAVGAGVLSLRLPERRSPAARAADRHRLAVHADLLAACLDSGMSIGAALMAVPAAGDLDPTAASG